MKKERKAESLLGKRLTEDEGNDLGGTFGIGNVYEGY
jgi:hypothetical protein